MFRLKEGGFIKIISIILIVFSFLFTANFKTAKALTANATMAISPTSGTYNLNDAVSVNVNLTSPTNAAAGVDVRITHSGNLTFVSADSTGTVFATEVTPATDVANVITFSSVRTDTGFIGNTGQLMRLNFTASAAGTATISIDKTNSSVIAYADSTDILQTVTNGSYTIQALANITLTASSDKTSVKTGDVVTYTLQYRNTGLGASSNTTITDTIPSGTTYVAASASNGGTLAGSVLTWTIGAVGVGTTASVTFQVTIN